MRFALERHPSPLKSNITIEESQVNISRICSLCVISDVENVRDDLLPNRVKPGRVVEVSGADDESLLSSQLTQREETPTSIT